MRQICSILSILSGLMLVVGALPVAAQSDLDRCTAATPQFPQACACVIERAQAAGITGRTLSQLLSNDMTGLPMDVFQSYGLIYVDCIQAAVLGTVPGAATLAPPTPTPPTTAVPTPAPQIAAPVPTPTPAAPAPAPAVPVANPGQWTPGRLALRHDAAQTTAEVMSASGRRARVFCDPRGGGWLTVDGVARGPGIDYDARLTVSGGRGVPEYGRENVRIEGDLLALDLGVNDFAAIAGGSEMRVVSVAHGLDERFGLNGSSRALRALECIDRSPFQVAPLVFEYTGDWLVYPAPPEGERGTAAFADLDTVAHEDLVLACTDHLSVPSWRGPSDGRGYALEVTLDEDPARSFIIDLLFNRGSAVPLDGMPEGFFRAVRDANLLRLRELQGGQMVEAVYDLSGLEPALQSLSCPPDAGTPLPPPPDGWHLVRRAGPFGGLSEVVRFATAAGQRVEFGCFPGSPLSVTLAPVDGLRVLSVPATLRADGVTLEAPVEVPQGDRAVLNLPYEIDRVLPGAETLEIAVPALGIDVAVPMAAPRPLIDGLGCAPAEPPVPLDPDFAGDFSGVDDQPWRQIAAPGLGPMLVQRPNENPELNLHIGCGGRLAFSALSYPGDGSDVYPVAFSVLGEAYPRPTVDFARAGDWWVAVEPALLRDIRSGPVFHYGHLLGTRIMLAYGITDLDRELASLCGE